MKLNLLLFLILLLSANNLNAEVIYTDPVENAELVNIENNIIIGFDGAVESPDLNSLISVRGTLSGIHSGETILTNDKRKLLFKPFYPFAFNETVIIKVNRVKTGGNFTKSFSFSFKTQIRKIDFDYGKILKEESGISLSFINNNRSSDLTLPVLSVLTSNNPSPGGLYMGNFPFDNTPNTPYLLISDNAGNFSYSRQVNQFAFDFKKQKNGLLTYFINEKYYSEDINHNILDSFRCGNGYRTDQHEFLILDNGHSLLMSYDPQIVNMSLIVPNGNPNATVIGLIIQELDVNKNVVFQWRSWDHFAITDANHVNLESDNIDYVHGNAIEQDTDGNLLISSRHLSEITKINRSNGNVIWRLGGSQNEFTFFNDTIMFSYQHDIRRIENGNITLYDNGNFHTPSYSRAVEYQLDEVNKTATLVWQYTRTPAIWGFAMGSVQRLRNGNTLIGWGSVNPTLTEVTPSGATALEMDLPAGIFTYRVFRDEVDLTLNLKLAIEGLYNNVTDKLNMKDTVRAYVRSNISPYNIIDSAKAVADSVNFKGSFRFYNIQSGTYYISLKHRNSLEVWSKSGGEIFAAGGVYLYDFTGSASNTYGNNVVQKGSKYCIYSGDVTQDGTVDGSDLSQMENDVSVSLAGYIQTDLNGDAFADAADLSIVENNAEAGIYVVTP